MSTALRLPSGGEESAEQRFVAPAGAAKLLRTSDNQSFVSHDVVQKYVREIQSGLWRQPRHTVVLFPDGSVAAGHVYLQAIVKANIAACLFVEQAVERTAPEVVDVPNEAVSIDDDDDVEPEFSHDHVSVVDKPGQFMMLDKNIINVDERYQRTVDDKRARGYSENFSWSAFGAVSLALRPDGTYWAFDAATRHRASMYIDSIKLVPCMVYRMEDIPAESVAFERINGFRKKINAFEEHKSQVVSGKTFAVFVDMLAKSQGYEVGKSYGRKIRCIKLMTDLAKQNKDVLARVWPLVVQLHDGSGIDKHVLASLFLLEANGDGDSIFDAKWKKRLLALGAHGVIEASMNGQDFFKSSSKKAWMGGVLNAINRGLPKEYYYRIKGESK